MEKRDRINKEILSFQRKYKISKICSVEKQNYFSSSVFLRKKDSQIKNDLKTKIKFRTLSVKCGLIVNVIKDLLLIRED